MLDAVLSLLPSPHREDRIYRSGCPFCGGDHRFVVSTKLEPAGRFHCFSCGRGGDLVTLVREVKKLGFKEACAWLRLSPDYVRSTKTQSWSGLETSSVGKRVTQGGREPSSFTERTEPEPPPPEWIMEATKFVDRCVKDQSPDKALYLYRRRFLDARCAAMDIGWHDRDETFSRQKWGLPPHKDYGDRLRIRRGLVFAWRRDGNIVGVKIRLTDEDLTEARRKYGDDYPKVAAITGSKLRPVAYHDPENLGGPCAVMESALDAALVYQQTDGLVSAIGLNSAAVKPERFHDIDMILRAARPLIIIPDIDQGAGEQKGKELEKTYWPYGVQCAVPYGKDPCELQSRAFQRDTFCGSKNWQHVHEEYPTVACWLFEWVLPFAVETLRERLSP